MGRPRQNKGELKAQWAKLNGDRPDMCYFWGEGIPKCDASLLHHFLNYMLFDGKSLLEELAARGYDITTFKLTVRKRQADGD